MGMDTQGLSFTGSTEASVFYDRALDHLVRFQTEVIEAQASARAADPRCAMAGVLGAYLSLMSTEAPSVADARAALGGIAGNPDALAPREQAHLAAAGLWLAGDMMGTGAILADISLLWPRDLLALFVGHQIDFFTGDAVSLRDRIGRAMWAWTPHDRLYGFVQGMYAFGLEECNLYGLSEEMAQRAVEANHDDVWGIHAMVHTYEMQGRIAEGVRFMRARHANWSAGNFLNVHNSWHYALYLLQGDDVPGALAVYDRVLHHGGSEDVALELLDASALLWRLHLEGQAVGDRWRPLADAWGRLLTSGYYPFNDMHATMAFIGAGDLERGRDLVADLEGLVERDDHESSSWIMTSRVGLPVCRSLLAFGDGAYEQVLRELWPVRTRLHEFGGSHAQRDAMERTLLESAIRAPRLDVARALVNERLGVREMSTYTWSKYAEALTGMGDESGASVASNRARVLANEILAAAKAPTKTE
ncbi:MAG: tetratricopeptide repeat protein [Acidimicrobiales bacterium]